MKNIIAAVLGLTAWSLSWADVTLNVPLTGTLPAEAVTFKGTSLVRALGAPTREDWTDNFTFEMASSGDLILSPLVKNFLDTSSVEITFNTQQNGSVFLLKNSLGDMESDVHLDKGKYTLTISGFTTGYGGGANYYTGTMHANYAPAVPEPSTYALMLLGLAGIGFVARRRMAGTVRT